MSYRTSVHQAMSYGAATYIYAVIGVYDADGNVIETQEHKGDFKEP